MAQETGSEEPATPEATDRAGARRPVRTLYVLCTVLVLALNAALVVGAIAVQAREARPSPASAAPVTEQVAVSSEDLAYFQDPSVEAEFKRHGYNVVPIGFGAGSLPSLAKIKQYDAVISSSQEFAEQIEGEFNHDAQEDVVFNSPIVILTLTGVVKTLRKLGIVTKQNEFDMAQYLKVAARGGRWDDVQAGTGAYSSTDKVQLEIADPRQTNTGQAFVAMASYVLNGDSVVDSESQVDAVAPKIGSLLGGLGLMEASTDQLFTEYATTGGVPMMLGYETEFVASTLSADPLPSGATFLYIDDSPVDSQDTAIALNNLGNDFISLMRTDAVLRNIAEQDYGFRVQGKAYFNSAGGDMLAGPDYLPTALRSIPVPTMPYMDELINAADPAQS